LADVCATEPESFCSGFLSGCLALKTRSLKFSSVNGIERDIEGFPLCVTTLLTIAPNVLKCNLADCFIDGPRWGVEEISFLSDGLAGNIFCWFALLRDAFLTVTTLEATSVKVSLDMQDSCFYID
jgi:hypothetical protein